MCPFDNASTYKTHDLIKTSLCDVDMAHVVYCLQDDIDLDNIASMIDAEAMALTINDLKESDNYLNSVASMIDAEAASAIDNRRRLTMITTMLYQ